MVVLTQPYTTTGWGLTQSQQQAQMQMQSQQAAAAQQSLNEIEYMQQ